MKAQLSVVLALGILAAGCTPQPSPSTAVTTPGTAPSSATPVPVGRWEKVEPGGDTRCAHNTPYAFWVRRGALDKLLVFFQGGGGCWDAATCAPGSTFYADSVTASDSPEGGSGILNLDHSENPFKDYSIVYIPSCTGDVHWGDNVRVYQGDGGTELTIYHRGFVNASAALKWAYEALPAPQSVFVTGCSAGSVGSAAFAPYVIEHYPDATVTQLGDSLAFVFHRPVELHNDYGAHDNFPKWIPAVSRIAPGQFHMADYYAEIANYYPMRVFAQYNTAHDRVQVRYYRALGGEPGGFEADLEASLASIHERAPNFRSYTAAGDAHCILPFDRFYTYQVQGVRFRDWVADLAAGKPVENVHCVDCNRVDLTTP